MALIGGVGRAVARSPRIGRRSTLVAAGLGMGAAVATSGVSGGAFDYTTEMLLGDPNADEAIMGKSMNWGNWINPMFNPATAGLAGATGGGMLGGLLGAAGGAARGGALGGIAGGLAGAGIGGMLGGGAAALGTIAPYMNSEIIGDAFSKDEGMIAAKRLAQKNADAGWNLTQVPNSSFIANSARPRRSYDTGATGDIVFGAYNMRMR